MDQNRRSQQIQLDILDQIRSGNPLLLSRTRNALRHKRWPPVRRRLPGALPGALAFLKKCLTRAHYSAIFRHCQFTQYFKSATLFAKQPFFLGKKRKNASKAFYPQRGTAKAGLTAPFHDSALRMRAAKQTAAGQLHAETCSAADVPRRAFQSRFQPRGKVWRHNNHPPAEPVVSACKKN